MLEENEGLKLEHGVIQNLNDVDVEEGEK